MSIEVGWIVALGQKKYRYRGAVSVVLLHLVNIKFPVSFKAVCAQPST